MKKLRTGIGFVALVLAGVVVAFLLPSARSAEWMTDLDAAKAKAAKERKPLLVEFTGTTWCPPCKLLEKMVLNRSEFADLSRDVVLVYLDYPTLSERASEKVAKNPELARLMKIKDSYGVSGFPTVFLFDPDGKQLGQVVGYGGQGPDSYLRELGLLR